MNNKYIKIIKDHDKTLSFLAKKWTKAEMRKKKSWVNKINDALDTRLDLMKLRDEDN
jgi:hypothetical protein